MKKILLCCILLSGCGLGGNYTTQSNQYYQNNYDTNVCYDGTKTFSQIIVCLQTANNKEQAQNDLTNQMLDQ